MIVKKLNEEDQYPINHLCHFVEMPRSTYYYRSRKTNETGLVKDLKKVAGKYPTYGTRRVCGELRRPPYGYDINRKRVQRIMRREKLLRRPKRKKRYTTDSNHPYPRYKNLVKDRRITYPDQVWVSDITYIHLGQGHVYLAIILDVFTRSIRGWYLGKSLGQGLQISMAGTGKPYENGYAERFMRTIKEEEVDLSEYNDFVDARDQIGHFIEDVYMTKRIHSSLGYLTPAEFETAWLSSKLATGTP
jgi:putative transposase